MDREQLLSHIKRKKIILFGAGGKAQEFYKDFKYELSISYCVSNNPTEKVMQIGGDMVCSVKPVSGMKKITEEFIITCGGDSFSMQKQLSDMGYRMGEDYIDSAIYRVLVGRKKIALFYGVCYMRAIKECLEYSRVFTNKYCSYYFLDYKAYSFTEQSLLYLLLCSCDLFVYISYLSPSGLRQIDAFLPRLKTDCKRIRIPLITFTGFYPRVSGRVNDANPYCIVSSKAPYSPFLVEDLNINDYINSNKTTDEIINLISDPDYYTKDFLNSNLSKQFQIIKIAEKFSDIKISHYIIDNYKKKRLFLNESHISNELLVEFVKQVLEKLELPNDIAEEEIQSLAPFLYSSEIPIYPSVIHHLDLTQYRDNAQYKLFTYQGIRMVTFEDYVVLYIEFCKNMKKYIEMGFFPM